MMRIDLPKEPYVLALPGFDFALKVRPLSTALMSAARAKANREVADLLAHAEAVKKAGGDVSGLPDFADDDQRAGVAYAALVKALASSAIIAWEGIADPDGNPAPVNPQTTGDLVGIYPIGERFLAAYLAPREMLDAEGNASGPAPNGTMEAGPNTADSAENPEPPVPEASEGTTESDAPASNTNP